MIVVFGGTGFIGRYLTYQLIQNGYDVLTVAGSEKGKPFCDKNNIRFLQVDIAKSDDFKKLPTKDINAVVHLAALIVELNPTVESVLNTIIHGTYNVLEYCNASNVSKIVNFSSHKVYSGLWSPKYIPIRPEQAGHFSGHASPYIISKLAAEQFVKHYAEEYNFDGITFRLTSVKGYGEILGSLQKDGSYKKSAIEIFIEKAIKGEPIEVWGEHKALRDHIYVKDVVSCVIKAIESKEKSGIYNLASGVGVTVDEEAKAIIDAFSPKENPSKIVYRHDIKDNTPTWVYDISSTVKTFNWNPKYSYKELMIDYKKESEIKRFRHHHFVNEEDRPIYW
jgi:UDP-glucose 4-epimerase